MKKDLVDIVMEKDYIQLTEAEREELSEFCSSEEEYNQLRDVFLSVEQMQFEQPVPRKETKERLDKLFDDTHPKVAPVWYMSVLATVVPREKPIYRQPLVQVAAVGLLLFLLFPLMNNQIAEESPVQVAEVIPHETTDQEPDVDVTVPEVTNTEVTSEAAETKTEPTRESVGDLTQPSGFAETRSAAGAAAPGFDHPDGIYAGGADDADEALALSQPASEEPEMLDLLTATF